MRGRKMFLQGYFTVEAALVLPIVIGTIIYIIYFQLFWYNRGLMDQDTAMLTLKATQEKSIEFEKIRDSVALFQEEYMTPKYAGWETDVPTISIKENRIKIQNTGKMPAWDSFWADNTSYEYKKMNPTAFVRLCRKIAVIQKGENEE